VPGFQFEAGQLGHEVEFARPDVPVRASVQPSLPRLVESEVVRHEVLARQVVRVQADVAGLGVEDHGVLARWESA